MLLKLAPTEEQHQALLETMHVFNQAAHYVAEIAFEEKSANKFALQKLVYGELRTTVRNTITLCHWTQRSAGTANLCFRGYRQNFGFKAILSF